MKSVIAVRHSKSSWGDSNLDDFERPLNERGKREAPEMARRLASRGIQPDYFLSSSAKRARKTAIAFAEELNFPKERIELKRELYLASAQEMFAAIAKCPESTDTVIFFSHNPGITEFVNRLTSVRTDNMPTSAIFAVSSACNDWPSFELAAKEFLFFDYPKAGI
ncbi:MAG: histidine phosphatase family protein [Chitinophagaceae bacterium]|nr:histidine phosphatase family protein [Chitinophagaceae bacterium]